MFFSRLSVILPLPLEILFHLNYQTRTTNVLIEYCNVFFIGLFVAILSSAALISFLDRLCYHTESLWVPSQEPKVEFWLGFLTSYIEASISPSTLGMEALSEMRMVTG